jgi:hypothetical protein
MSDRSRCEHCLHKCFTEKTPDCRDPKKRPKSIHILFNEIKEKISNGKNQNISFFIFVEGNLDEKFWKKIKKSDSIGIIRITNPSCENISDEIRTEPKNYQNFFIKTNKSAIECLFCKDHKHLTYQYSYEEDFFVRNKAIGMVDMDFQHQSPSDSSNYDPDRNIQYDPLQFYPLFRTETRDLEIMLCKLGGLRQFLLNRVELVLVNAKEELERKSDEIQWDLLDQAVIPGFARYLNAEMKFFVKFDRLKKVFGVNPFWSFVCNKGKIDCSDIISLLRMNEKNLHGRPLLFFASYRERCPKLVQVKKSELWTICQGHDTMQILECLVRCGKIKFKDPVQSLSEIDLSNIILNEFIDKKCYGRSEMIARIIDWEKQYHPSNYDSSATGQIFIEDVYLEFNKNTEKEPPVRG